MLKIMKKKKNSLFKNLIFALLFGISSVCLLGGWSLDNNDNLVSDNIYSGQKYYKYDNSGSETIEIGQTDYNINEITLTDNLYFYIKITGATLNNRYFTGFSLMVGYGSISSNEIYFSFEIEPDASGNYPYASYGDTLDVNTEIYYFKFIKDTSNFIGQKINYISYDIYGDYCETDDFMISYKDNLYEYQPYNELYYNEDNIAGITFDISQYSVSVGSVPNPPSFVYTIHQNLTDNFSSVGYLNISNIYTNYIQSGNNNSIYITTPQSNLLTFDLIFNFISVPSTMIKTTLYLPNGNLQQFSYSVDNFQYNQDWTLANLVGSTSIGANFNLNEISYKDVLITYESGHNTLSEIKIGSNNGFNIGFNSGYNTALDRIKDLTTELNEKTSQLETVTTELYAKTIQYEHLYTRFQQLSDTPLQLNFQTLLWNIASTPFEAFKNMWNFNFLGFNIAQFVTR